MANDALAKLIAELLGASKRDVSVVQGLASRQKLLEVRCDIAVDDAKQRLWPCGV